MCLILSFAPLACLNSLLTLFCMADTVVFSAFSRAPANLIQAIDHSEDMYTGFKMTEFGYRVRLCFMLRVFVVRERSFASDTISCS